MKKNSFEDNKWMNRAKWLTQGLILSGTLNLGLLSTFVYFVLNEKEQTVEFENRPLEELTVSSVPTNEKLLETYATLSFSELLIRLEDKELIEEGYAKRDLSLACLAAFHHLNLEQALGGLDIQKRQIAFTHQEGGEKIAITIFPGLTDDQYEAILHYARTEKWPLTSQGLFFELLRGASPRDPSLLEAFYLTPEFHAVYTLFTRLGSSLEKESIAELLLQGSWSLLQNFVQQQKQAQDLSINRRRSFLMDYLNQRSFLAAEWLLQTDLEFVSKRFDDSRILLLLDLLTDKSPSIERFAKDLLLSPRTDAVRKKAAAKLYALVGEGVPEPYDHRVAIARFVAAATTPNKPIEKKPVAPLPKKKPIIHVVQPGESLWKIARRYHVTIEAIMKLNHLETEKLKLGRKLEIPSTDRKKE